MDLVSSLGKNFILCCVLFLIERIGARDDYGTWHKTLTPFQSHACDHNNLVLQCSVDTIISVHYVFYGSQEKSSHLCPGSIVPHPGECESKKALEVIRDRCHGHRICRLQTSPETFRDDPCPGIRKYIEVMYKCRPELFRNKIVCEDGQFHLNCPSGQGLTIYSASFGTTQSGAIECRQPEGIQPADCLINHADETVRSICSGKQNCSLRADIRTFGNPHCLGTKYLKVAYNCVEKKYLLPTTRPPSESIQTTSYPAWAVAVDQSSPNIFRSRDHGLNGVFRPSDTSKLEMQSDEVPTNYKKESLSGNQELVGFISKWVSAQKYMTGNRDKLILYISLSLGLGIVACATILSARCLVRRLGSRRSSKFNMTPETEDQFFSDSDLEQYDPPESLPPPIANYTASMKRHGSDVLPRAPIDNSIEHNHYFS